MYWEVPELFNASLERFLSSVYQPLQAATKGS
jgi:hypothetical protein